MTEPKDSAGLDTEAIDDAWGDEQAPVSAPMVPSKPVARALRAPRAPRPLPAPVPAPAGAADLPPDDEIEFEADVVARDSMPTFQHPNPLEFDRDPDAEEKARPPVPKPPRLPKLPRR